MQLKVAVDGFVDDPAAVAIHGLGELIQFAAFAFFGAKTQMCVTNEHSVAQRQGMGGEQSFTLTALFV